MGKHLASHFAIWPFLKQLKKTKLLTQGNNSLK
jgi:hypothetical protein